ncbi:MAG: hypothetical protein ABI895_34940 [Deltaproteobacteria bacterium]
MMAKKPRYASHLAWLLLGLGPVLLSGPIGNWRYSLDRYLWIKVQPWDLDQAPGWLALIAGWCCIAHAFGQAREPPSHLTGFARMRFQLRWLPVPILGTLGAYVALAYHHVSPLVLIIDVENVPAGATLEGGACVRSFEWHESRYGAAFDYLFGVDRPDIVQTSFSNQTHAEFRFAAGGLSLQNWQPELERVFLGIEDGAQDNAAFLVLRIEGDLRHSGTIRVTHQSLKECQSPEHTKAGACLIQVTPHSPREREVRVVFDLADVKLEQFDEGPFYRVDLLWGPKL